MSFNDLTVGFTTLLGWLMLIGSAMLVAYMLVSAMRDVLRKSSRTRG